MFFTSTLDWLLDTQRGLADHPPDKKEEEDFQEAAYCNHPESYNCSGMFLINEASLAIHLVSHRLLILTIQRWLYEILGKSNLTSKYVTNYEFLRVRD